MSVRRTNSPTAGPGKARVPGPSTINAPQSTYLFGAVCPERGAGAALVLPACNTEAMQLHLDEIATKVTPGAHAVLILDQAGWHGAKDLKAPKNISLLPLPPRAPELNHKINSADRTFLAFTGRQESAACSAALPYSEAPSGRRHCHR